MNIKISKKNYIRLFCLTVAVLAIIRLFIPNTDNNKPVKFEIKRSDIKKISISDNVFLNIFLDYDKCIRIFSSDCEKLLEKLSKEGFTN